MSTITPTPVSVTTWGELPGERKLPSTLHILAGSPMPEGLTKGITALG